MNSWETKIYKTPIYDDEEDDEDDEENLLRKRNESFHRRWDGLERNNQSLRAALFCASLIIVGLLIALIAAWGSKS